MISQNRNCFRVVGPVSVHFLAPLSLQEQRTSMWTEKLMLFPSSRFYFKPITDAIGNSLILDFKNVCSAHVTWCKTLDLCLCTVRLSLSWWYCCSVLRRTSQIKSSIWCYFSSWQKWPIMSEDVLVEWPLYCFCCETPRISPINKP